MKTPEQIAEERRHEATEPLEDVLKEIEKEQVVWIEVYQAFHGGASHARQDATIHWCENRPFPLFHGELIRAVMKHENT